MYDVILEHSLAAEISSHVCFVYVCLCCCQSSVLYCAVVVLNNLLVSGKVTVLHNCKVIGIFTQHKLHKTQTQALHKHIQAQLLITMVVYFSITDINCT